jgi:hypothetical protein
LGNKHRHVNEILSNGWFNKLAIAVFICGFFLGVFNGSQAYTSAPDTVGWQFVFSDGLKYWVPSFLIGMIFIGLQKIISLLIEIRDDE